MEKDTSSETSKNSENTKTKIDKLEKEILKLKKEIESLEKSKKQWKDCALLYADKFHLAYKGFLMTQGKSEKQAQEESLKILDQIPHED